MKAVIGGAGLAGLALAMRLAKAGWDVTVVDPGTAPHDEAYIIDLFGSGYEAAERLGILAKLAQHQHRFDGIRWTNETGRAGAWLARTAVEQLLQGPWMSLLRSDLERAMLELLPREVELRYGAPIRDIRIPTGAVHVTLDGGETIAADVLIGADGLHSSIRNLVSD